MFHHHGNRLLSVLVQEKDNSWTLLVEIVLPRRYWASAVLLVLLVHVATLMVSVMERCSTQNQIVFVLPITSYKLHNLLVKKMIRVMI